MKPVFVCAHGAGGHKDDRSMLRLSTALESRGTDVVRFNFGYREKGSRRIDPMPVLKQRFSTVASEHRRNLLIIGGRSMGGRVASLLAADGFPCSGLLLAAYPLHPAGKPAMLRDAHFSRIRVPLLFICGTRDPLCQSDLMETSLEKLQAPWEMHWLEGADHSFRVLKSAGRTDGEVDAEVGDVAERWLAGLAGKEAG